MTASSGATVEASSEASEVTVSAGFSKIAKAGVEISLPQLTVKAADSPVSSKDAVIFPQSAVVASKLLVSYVRIYHTCLGLRYIFTKQSL